jgi:hypothetical protein
MEEKMNKQKQHKGQIVVILAVAMVAILAVTALAVDGSLVYNDRRTDQSTADSAALAGAGAAAQIMKDHPPSDFYCGSSLGAQASTAAVNAAIQAAQLEDEVTLASQDLTTGNGVKVTCGADVYGMKYLDINTVVSSETQTFFAKAIGRDTLSTSVKSVARVYPKQPFAYGNGLVSLSPDCGKDDGGIYFQGSSFTYINEGGIFSNSCIVPGGEGFSVEVDGGAINYISTCPDCAGANISPLPQKAPVPLPTDMIDPPKCTSAPFVNMPTSGTVNPGNYNNINPSSHATLILNPGLYCIKDKFLVNNGVTIIGHKVTLYLMGNDLDLDFTLNGHAVLDLSAPDCETPDPSCGVPPAIRGMLVYINDDAWIKITGNSDMHLMGTFYAPRSHFTIIGDTEGSALKTQIIGWSFYISGNSYLNMNMDGAEMVQKPSSLSLVR